MIYDNMAVLSSSVLSITLNRPEKRNALDKDTISRLTEVFIKASSDRAVHIATLTGAGSHFCSGADLTWMRESANLDFHENEREAIALADLMWAIDSCEKPVLCLVNGPAYGAGIGLIACCDIAIASATARFALTEVRLGLIPAIISPYVVRAIGARQCRRWFLSAEDFDAKKAEELGLIHETIAAKDLIKTGDEIKRRLLEIGPHSLKAAKDLVRKVAAQPIDIPLRRETAKLIAEQRLSEEARERIAAFLESRTRRRKD